MRADAPPSQPARRGCGARSATQGRNAGTRSSERGGVRPRTALAEQGDLPSDYAMGLRMYRSLAYIGTRLRELEMTPYMVQTYA